MCRQLGSPGQPGGRAGPAAQPAGQRAPAGAAGCGHGPDSGAQPPRGRAPRSPSAGQPAPGPAAGVTLRRVASRGGCRQVRLVQGQHKSDAGVWMHAQPPELDAPFACRGGWRCCQAWHLPQPWGAGPQQRMGCSSSLGQHLMRCCGLKLQACTGARSRPTRPHRPCWPSWASAGTLPGAAGPWAWPIS